MKEIVRVLAEDRIAVSHLPIFGKFAAMTVQLLRKVLR